MSPVASRKGGSKRRKSQRRAPAAKPPAPEVAPHGYTITKPVRGSDIPADYAFVVTRDEIYVPIAVRKPDGAGPFPVITMASGNGREGMRRIEEFVDELAPMQDRMIARGFVVASVNYRNEIPHLYETRGEGAHNLPDSVSGDRRTLKSSPTLDHEDFISIVRYLKTLPYVDPNGIGAIGVSHSGEIILKASSEYPLGAGVCVEPAAHEFLTVDTGPKAPRKGTEIQYNDVNLVRKNAKKADAMKRIRPIRTPILFVGRDKDHLQGIFRLAYEWMREAGKNATWRSFDHPVHGYPFVYRQPDGSEQPDAIQAAAFEIFMEFFERHLKRRRASARR
jgi:dienelactone hydrolase